MLMTAKKGPATYADIEALPEHVVGEILDGELIVSPRPASPHAIAASQLWSTWAVRSTADAVARAGGPS